MKIMEKLEEEIQTVTKEDRIFGEYPVVKAVATMVIPTIISQIITVIYNLADTWFVGLAQNAAAVAAISLCLPVYTMMTAFSNLFGIGGASALARALGVRDKCRAERVFAVSVFGSLCSAILYSLVLCICARPLLMLIGGDASSIDYAVWYTRITIVIGGVPTIMSATFAQLIRATGESKKASFGITLGAILNMVLDPLFMFVILPKGNEVIGAAIATAISNVVSALYFLIYIFKHKEENIFRFKLHRGEGLRKTFVSIVKCGAPSFCLVGMAMFSNCFLNGMIAEMGSSAAVAGIGIVRKVDSLAYAVNQGITQGMLPIVAYCYSSGRYKRMKSVIGFSSICTVSFSLICSICSYIFAPYLIRFFINDADTIIYGSQFLRVLCIAVAIYPLLFVIIAVFQAVGESVKPFLLSLLHKGSVDIVLLFVIRKIWGLEYILWAAPVMDAVALVVAVLLCMQFFGKMKENE